MTKNKRQRGQFYTVVNPFAHRAFRAWAKRARLPQATILEPFAGCNSLITHLQAMNLCGDYTAYDIAPAADGPTAGPTAGVQRRDTLARFPRNYDVCITNPPWLARNSATRRGLCFPDTKLDDLYKYCVARCLDNCGYVAVLVPESFIRSGLFRERLHAFISLTQPIFADTEHPTGLAMFVPHATRDAIVYSGRTRVGLLAEIERQRPQVRADDLLRKIVFNVPDGKLGLIAVDNTHRASIRFCHPRELKKYDIGGTSRYITRITVQGGAVNITRLNDALHHFREATGDVLMTPYRGLRKDGKYRRRLDWDLARGLVCAA